MHCSIFPGELKGSIAIPASKSQTLRAILFASFSCGKSVVYHPLHSPDIALTLRACRLLGAEIIEKNDHLEIWGKGTGVDHPSCQIDVGGLGISFRFLSALCALAKSETTIEGDYALSHLRPTSELFYALEQLGAQVTFHGKSGFAPVTIKGPISSGHVKVHGPDSQPVSALLIAASFLEGKTTIDVVDPGERAWIDLTLSWLDTLGIAYTRRGYEQFIVEGAGAIEGFSYEVNGDWSSAAFPIIAALITKSRLILENLDFSDSQGDRTLLHHLEKMGAKFTICPHSKTLTVEPSILKGTSLSLDSTIDALPALAALAPYVEGETLLYDARSARLKESDRIHAMKCELEKMGANILERPDGLLIKKSLLRGNSLNSHSDHRIAMALFAAALGASGESQLEGIEWIDKTFPCFLRKMRQIGARVELGETISSSVG